MFSDTEYGFIAKIPLKPGAPKRLRRLVEHRQTQTSAYLRGTKKAQYQSIPAMFLNHSGADAFRGLGKGVYKEPGVISGSMLLSNQTLPVLLDFLQLSHKYLAPQTGQVLAYFMQATQYEWRYRFEELGLLYWDGARYCAALNVDRKSFIWRTYELIEAEQLAKHWHWAECILSTEQIEALRPYHITLAEREYTQATVKALVLVEKDCYMCWVQDAKGESYHIAITYDSEYRQLRLQSTNTAGVELQNTSFAGALQFTPEDQLLLRLALQSHMRQCYHVHLEARRAEKQARS